MNKPLTEYKHNYHSQNGEDGILEEVLNRLGVFSEQRVKWCVEFGAWDGIRLSNTYHLIKEKGFHATLIEGDKNKYVELCKNLPSEDVQKICCFVKIKGENTLDSILGRTGIPADFDLLSIDIDGCDYHIWKSLTHHRPKIVCIEYNPTIPVEVNFMQPPKFKIKWGASAKALDNLAKAKGYQIVAVTDTNLIFVRSDLAYKVIGEENKAIEDHFFGQQKFYLFFGFDGTVLSNKKAIRMPWTRLKYKIKNHQRLPKILRQYRHDYSPWKKILYKIWLVSDNPGKAFSRLINRLKR